MSAVGQPQGQKTQTARPDPEEGTLNGLISMTDLESKDPNKHYVFVSRGRHMLQEYKRMGYKPEVGTENGVRIAGEDVEVGKEIECMDHLLMSVSSEHREKIEKHGANGGIGQVGVDQLDKKMLDNRNIADSFRGKANTVRGRRYFDFQSENSED